MPDIKILFRENNSGKVQSVSQGILWPGEGEKDLEISTGGGRFFPFPTCTGIASLQLANLKPALLVINKPPEVIILMSKSKLRGPKREKMRRRGKAHNDQRRWKEKG